MCMAIAQAYITRYKMATITHQGRVYGEQVVGSRNGDFECFVKTQLLEIPFASTVAVVRFLLKNYKGQITCDIEATETNTDNIKYRRLSRFIPETSLKIDCLTTLPRIKITLRDTDTQSTNLWELHQLAFDGALRDTQDVRIVGEVSNVGNFSQLSTGASE